MEISKQSNGLFKRAGSPYWCLSVTNEKKQRQRYSLKTTNLKEAIGYAEKVRTQIRECKWIDKDKARHHTFEDLILEYLSRKFPREFKMAIAKKHSIEDIIAYAKGSTPEQVKAKKKKKANAKKEKRVFSKTLKNYCTYIKHFIENEDFAGQTLDKITKAEISRYRDKRNSEVSPQTVVHELNFLSKLFDLASNEWEWINENPLGKLKRPCVDNERDRYLTFEEAPRLFKAAQGRLNNLLPELITLGIYSGLRKEKVLLLQWPQIDLFGRNITHVVQRNKKPVPKKLAMNDTLYNLFLRKSKQVSKLEGYVFCTKNGTPFSAANLDRDWWKAREEAGISDFHWHDFRHTCATWARLKGGDLSDIQDMLGHKDIASTQRYAHHHPDRLKAVVKLLDDFDFTGTSEALKEVPVKIEAVTLRA